MLVLASCSSSPSATQASTPSNAPSLLGHIAFVDRPIAGGPFHLYVMAPDGGERKLVNSPPPGPSQDDHPRFSPDGTKILFERADAIMVVNADGTGLRAIAAGCTGSCLGDNEPAWSHDGIRIAFGRAIGDNGTPHDVGIWIADADGSHPHQITQLVPNSGFEDHYPSFSPDGQELLFMRDGDHPENLDQASIWRIGVDGKDPRLIYRLPDDRPGGGEKPRWSPDGSRILFSDICDFDSCRPAAPFVPQVFSIRPDGSDLQQLTRGSTASSVPAWSPDGQWIVFSSQLASGLAECDGHGTELYIMKADGTGIQRITTSMASGCDPYNPDWGA